MKNKIIIFFSVLLILLILCFIIFRTKYVEIKNNDIFDDQLVTEEMLNNAIIFKVNNIIIDNDDSKLEIILRDNKIIEAIFINELANFNYIDNLEIGDELYVDGNIENNVLYISKIYKNYSIKERQDFE